MIKMLLLFEDKKPSEYYGPPNISLNLVKILNNRNFNVSIQIIALRSILQSNLSYKLINLVKMIKDILTVCLSFHKYDIINLQYFKGIHYVLYGIIPSLFKPMVIQIYFPFKRDWVLYLKRNAVYVVMNPYMEKYLINKGLNQNKIKIIGPPIDTEKFKKLSKLKLRKKYDIPLNKFVVAYHGRPSTIRGLKLSLDSLIQVKEEIDELYILLSIADVDDEDLSINYIKEFIYKNDLNKITKLIVGKNISEEIYNLADVLVFPFIKKGASICPPLSVLEAMACESVVITSNIEELGTKYIINNEINGFLIEPTSKELCESLIKIEEMDTNELDHIGKEARKTIIEEYSPDVIENKYREICK